VQAQLLSALQAAGVNAVLPAKVAGSTRVTSSNLDQFELMSPSDVELEEGGRYFVAAAPTMGWCPCAWHTQGFDSHALRAHNPLPTMVRIFASFNCLSPDSLPTFLSGPLVLPARMPFHPPASLAACLQMDLQYVAL
jgi:hypothetical protein